MQSERLQIDEGCNAMSLDQKQIYIVDDDESVRCALKFLLVAYGFAVDTYPSSEDFFSAIPNNSPGCLILDINMPGLDGWHTLQKLIKTKSSRPVIIITTDRNDDHKQKLPIVISQIKISSISKYILSSCDIISLILSIISYSQLY